MVAFLSPFLFRKLITFISATAREIGSLEFKYAKEHTEPLKAITPVTSFWLHAL